MGRLIAGGFALIYLLALTACTTPDDQPATASPPSATAATVATATPTSAPASTLPPGEHGGAIVAVTQADIDHRDVHRDISATLASRGPGVAYSRMLRLRTGEDVAQPSLLLECDLCKTWEMEGPLTYTFRLREGIRWQDLPPVNGRGLTAGDVAFSYERQKTEGWPNSPLLLAMDTAEAVDDSVLRVTLRFSDTDFLAALADGRSKVVAREAVEAEGSLENGPVVGTGPWIWLRTVEGDGSALEANPDYFEEGLPFVKQLTFKVIKDSDTRIAAFITGLVDVYDAPPHEWAVLQSRGFTNRTFLSKEGGLGMLLAMNVGNPPFDDQAVRREVFKVLDPWSYLEEKWSGQGYVSAGVPVVTAQWLLDRQAMEPFFGGETAMVGGGRSFEIVVADFGDIYLAAGKRLEEALRLAGFDPTVMVLNPVDYSDRVWQKKDYQLFLGPVPPTSTPNSYLFSLLHSGGQWNILDHEDSDLDSLVEAQQQAPFDSDRRGEGLKSIQRWILDQAYMVGLGGNGSLWVLQDGVNGFYPNTALSEYFFWAKTWRGSLPSLGG